MVAFYFLYCWFSIGEQTHVSRISGVDIKFIEYFEHFEYQPVLRRHV